jgi:hypothetical protein
MIENLGLMGLLGSMAPFALAAADWGANDGPPPARQGVVKVTAEDGTVLHLWLLHEIREGIYVAVACDGGGDVIVGNVGLMYAWIDVAGEPQRKRNAALRELRRAVARVRRVPCDGDGDARCMVPSIGKNALSALAYKWPDDALDVMQPCPTIETLALCTAHRAALVADDAKGEPTPTPAAPLDAP